MDAADDSSRRSLPMKSSAVKPVMSVNALLTATIFFSRSVIALR
jgi:hypothetical protein